MHPHGALLGGAAVPSLLGVHIICLSWGWDHALNCGRFLVEGRAALPDARESGAPGDDGEGLGPPTRSHDSESQVMNAPFPHHPTPSYALHGVKPERKV